MTQGLVFRPSKDLRHSGSGPYFPFLEGVLKTTSHPFCQYLATLSYQISRQENLIGPADMHICEYAEQAHMQTVHSKVLELARKLPGVPLAVCTAALGLFNFMLRPLSTRSLLKTKV